MVTDSRSPRDGRNVESIGTYNPLTHPAELHIEEEKALYWMDHGAIPSDTCASLFRSQGILYKRSLLRKGLDEASIQQAMSQWDRLQSEKRQRQALKKEERKKKKSPEAKAEGEEAGGTAAPADAGASVPVEPVKTTEGKAKEAKTKPDSAGDKEAAETGATKETKESAVDAAGETEAQK